jgi:hypothetical protein
VKEIIFGYQLWIPFVFLAAFLAMSALLSEVSRWPRLAARFPGGARPSGPVLTGQVTNVGGISDRRITYLVPTSEGLYMYVTWACRFRRSPIMLPWSEVELLSTQRFLLWQRHDLSLGKGITTITVKDEGFRALAPFLPAMSSHS